VSLDGLNQSNLRAFQRYCEAEITRMLGRMEGAANAGDDKRIYRTAGAVAQLRHIIHDCEREIARLDGKDNNDIY